MQFLKQHSLFLLLGVLFATGIAYFAWIDSAYLSLFPIALVAIYFAVFYSDKTFLLITFLTPLSINIEEWVEGFGLYIPTEPLLFGLMLLLLMKQLREKIIPAYIWKQPIIWAAGFYLFWIIVTSITSSNPLASFKFLLAKLWFLVPLLLFAPLVYKDQRNIKAFIWLFSVAMIIVILYTVSVHASYGFGEQEGHWVMWPFFKDHTIYGAMVAFIVPLTFGLYFSKKHTPLVQLVLIGLMLVNLIGLYFSYTRAAWLSVVASLVVLIIIRLKIRIVYIASIVLIAGTALLFSWDSIQMELERNKYEHTTEEFGEKLQSATNVTTDASNLERLNRWSCAIEMFKERPVLGFGPGTFAFEYARFQDPENLTIISTNFGDMGNAHSEFLGPLSEMGLPGLIAILLLVGAIFYQGITVYNQWPAEDRQMRTLIISMVMALVTYFVHGLLNNYLDTDKASVPIWTICAIFIALKQQLPTEKSKGKGSNN